MPSLHLSRISVHAPRDFITIALSIASLTTAFTHTLMIPLRRSPVFAIRIPWLYGRSCVSRERWFSTGAQMTSKTLPTLSLQGKVSNDIVFTIHKQMLYGTTGLSCDWGRSGTWE
jgi:hypothetical protein